jgi:hypothetical protein
VLLRLYRPRCDLRDLARYFAVSPGAITDALSRLVRIAKRLERDETLQNAASGMRYVVIVPSTMLLRRNTFGRFWRSMNCEESLKNSTSKKIGGLSHPMATTRCEALGE